ncbi:Hpt domain-containing protein [Salinivibrio socompensis]|uniref:Hpt domain-containing protein n=1 Tax=Salinivibrio socompensis TaxID=1510206 RepID=UPI0004728A99|nr:Hpt domain-containing protein [Salinivibrio socompensis]
MSVNQGKADMSVWDKEEALSRLMDSPALLDEACRIFVEESEQQLPVMARQLADADYADLAREAHKMKGSAGNLAALELYQHALTLEQAAKQDATEQATAALASIKEGLSRFCAQLTH